MESAALAVADTTPLIALHAVGLLEVLHVRFGEVLVPLTVWGELNALPGSPEPDAVGRLPTVRLAPDLASLPLSLSHLDPGEQQVLAMAMANPQWVALLDDGDGRRAARAAGLKYMGTIGLIAAAKDAGLCESARERYLRLLTTGFRIDRRIVNDLLRDLGEPELPR